MWIFYTISFLDKLKTDATFAFLEKTSLRKHTTKQEEKLYENIYYNNNCQKYWTRIQRNEHKMNLRLM